MQKLTLTEVQNKDLQSGWISTAPYTGRNKKRLYVCPKCKHECLTTPDMIWSGHKKTCGQCCDVHIGDRLNHFTILNIVRIQRGYRVTAQCDCGNIWNGILGTLKKNQTCGHCKDVQIGQKYNKLTICQIIYNGSKGCAVVAQCECGNTWTGSSSIIASGKILSCGKCNKPKVGDTIHCFTIRNVYDGKTKGCTVTLQCQCGRIISGRWCHFYNGNTKSCGHCNDPNIGDKFGRLTICKVFPHKHPGCRVECICDCGNHWFGHFKLLKNGNKKSCGCLKSRGEFLIESYLKQHNIIYQTQKRFIDCRGLRYPLPFDFYLPEYHICIEYNGIQHYEKVTLYEQTIPNYFTNIIQRDIIKKQYCYKHHISLLIIKYTNIHNIANILDNYILPYIEI